MKALLGTLFRHFEYSWRITGSLIDFSNKQRYDNTLTALMSAKMLNTGVQVIAELRDREVRCRVRDSPLEMTYATPSSEAVRRVSDFARKTGDYASLSAVDVRLALAFIANPRTIHFKLITFQCPCCGL